MRECVAGRKMASSRPPLEARRRMSLSIFFLLLCFAATSSRSRAPAWRDRLRWHRTTHPTMIKKCHLRPCSQPPHHQSPLGQNNKTKKERTKKKRRRPCGMHTQPAAAQRLAQTQSRAMCSCHCAPYLSIPYPSSVQVPFG